MKNMAWHDAVQWGSLLLVALVMPISFHLGLWVTLLLALASIAKMIAQRGKRNTTLTARTRWAMLTPVLYCLGLAVSLLWTDDLATGMVVLRLKAILCVLPLSMLLTDTSYLTARHLRALGYAFLTATVGRLLYCCGRAVGRLLAGESLTALTTHFDPLHHAYVALYATLCLLFLYAEWRRLGATRKWVRTVMPLLAAMMAFYTVAVNSRAGILSMGIVGVAIAVHQAYLRRSWKMGVGIGVAALLALFLIGKALPGHSNRLASTLEHAETDVRTKIYRSNLRLVARRPVLGYGVGDYHALQMQQYGQDGDFGHKNATFNSHNQYLESHLAAGLLGLLLFVTFVLAPLWGNRRWTFTAVMAVAVVAINCLFESMLERQMGLQTIGFLLVILTFYRTDNVEKEK